MLNKCWTKKLNVSTPSRENVICIVVNRSHSKLFVIILNNDIWFYLLDSFNQI